MAYFYVKELKMKEIEIHGSTGLSKILVGENLINLKSYIPDENVVLITDENVSQYYRKQFPDYPVITIGTGESVKTLDTAAYIYQNLLDMNAQRSTMLVGIGGGIVCDITGFVASTYLRGISFGFVSSTLLSQVDASVGGKNGVNFKGYKNMVGVFNQPSFVICDLNLLKTLPERDLLSGFAEIVKHAAIEDADLFEYLEKNYKKALSLDLNVIERLVYDSVVIKASVVNRDEKEKGERRKLNFGHTLGHAIEKTTGIPHGEAVSLGMIFAALLSVKKGLLSSAEKQQLATLLKNLKLPTAVDIDKNKIMDALNKDKKREGKGIHFVLLDGIGKAVIEEISIIELHQALDNVFDKT
uniref:3-dehydroquinate synthase n=2 Tax=Desulfobacterium TaxID=2295 RepID=E1YHH6_9BACT|nr:3-dehydroquinate synthase [uncultured Desulfobacterium sp.]